MFSIVRVDQFGFINFAVHLDGVELVRFEKYGLAVDFIRAMDDIG